MEINAIPCQVRASELPLDKLAANPNISDSDKVAEVSRQFEAILLRQILNEAHKKTFASTYVSDSVSSSIYQDMVTNQLADSISKSGALGLAKTLDHQLGRQCLAKKPSLPAASANNMIPPTRPSLTSPLKP